MTGVQTCALPICTTASTGTLAALANNSDTLTGLLSIQVGTGTAQIIVVGAAPIPPALNTFYTGTASSANTLTGLMDAVNTAGIGVTASIVTNGSGKQSLSLLSNTVGSAGTLTVNSRINDNTGTTPLTYANPVVGADASLTVDGVTGLTSASNTVANLIPGVTFQLLAPSATLSGGGLESVQVLIANDNGGVESTFNQMVSDYNSLISAVNTQEGNDVSGKAEPLFGSPTLSLLQQQLLGGLNMQSPNGYLTAISTSNNTTLAGSISIQVGNSAAQSVTVPTTSGNNTISGLASAINTANIGVTASVVTHNGQSSLTLASQTAGSSGTLTVNSSIVATSDLALKYTGTAGTSTTYSTGNLTAIANAGDTLSGSVIIEAGSGATTQFDISTLSDQTLTGLSSAINNANIGVTASVVTSAGVSSLNLVSQTLDTAGNLLVSSSLLDTNSTSSSTLSYTKSSDIGNLTSLGISVNNDGSLTFDAASMDAVLNSDYSGVVGFFQNANGWGQTFNTMLTNAGVSSSTGILSLGLNSNSRIESTLNAEISREEAMISLQQISLTKELNTANQIMQSIPNMLNQVNELYAAITGYGQNLNG